MTDPVVSTAWLAERLDDRQPDLRILDCRYYFDDVERGRREYLAAHIPGALYVDWTRDLSEPKGALQTMAPTFGFLRATMERLGVGDSTTIVGYDDEGGHYVSRLWNVMRMFGHATVRLLEGGWTKWLAEGRPTRAGAEPNPTPSSVPFTQCAERPDVFVDTDTVLARRSDAASVLVDVRRRTEWTGEELRAKHGGHIPWARWLFWQDNLNWLGNRDFRDLEQVRSRFQEEGVTPDKNVIVYCQGGVRASHTALTLTRLGYESVQVYDGSWEEWGSRDDLPIAHGD